MLRLECTNCKTKAQLALKRCKHFELGYVKSMQWPGGDMANDWLIVVIRRRRVLLWCSRRMLDFARFSTINAANLGRSGTIGNLCENKIISSIPDACKGVRDVRGFFILYLLPEPNRQMLQAQCGAKPLLQYMPKSRLRRNRAFIKQTGNSAGL